MLKKPLSRNQRTKGIRVKHILQIALLLGVCFWLAYQLKHSYDNKVALGENDPKTSVRTQTESELLKLGRKDIPHKDVTTQLIREEEDEEEALREEEEKHEVEDENHEAEEREEEDQKHQLEETDEEGQKHEVEQTDKEGQKHEAEEQEEEEIKDEDPEDVGKGGDEKIEENDLETEEGEDDHNEKLVDEEKEREDGGDDNDSDKNEEDRENQEDNENSSDEGSEEKSHEAREEHYKADDASSAVTHDTQVISTETEKINSESTNETSETSEGEDGNQHSMRLVNHGETSENGNSNVTASEEKHEVNSSDPVVNSLVDADGKSQSRNLPEVGNNSSFVSSEASDNLAAVNQGTSAHQPNETETISESTQSQNAAADGVATREGSDKENVIVEQTNDTKLVEDQLNSTVTVPSIDAEFIQTNVSENKLLLDGAAKGEEWSAPSIIKETTGVTEHEELKNEDSSNNEELKNKDVSENEESKNGDASKNEESKNEDASKNEESVNVDVHKNEEASKNEESVKEDSTMNEESVKEDSTMNEESNQNTSKTEDSEETIESNKADEGSDSTNTTDDTIQHDPIDSSDSHVSEAEKEARTDLDTLPEIQTEGDENGEAAAE